MACFQGYIRLMWNLSSSDCIRNTLKIGKCRATKALSESIRALRWRVRGSVNPWKCHHTLGVFVWRLSVTDCVRCCQQPEWLIKLGDECGNRCYNHIACVPKSDNVTILKSECNSKQHIFFQFLQWLINQILPITSKKGPHSIFPFTNISPDE